MLSLKRTKISQFGYRLGDLGKCYGGTAKFNASRFAQAASWTTRAISTWHTGTSGSPTGSITYLFSSDTTIMICAAMARETSEGSACDAFCGQCTETVLHLCFKVVAGTADGRQ
jgi:hypothetical protein